MTRSNAKDWFRTNTSTEQRDGVEVVVYTHPTETECPYCGVVHSFEVKEWHDLDGLASRYQTAMENATEASKHIPEKAASNVADAIRNNAGDTGHERFVEGV